MKLLLYGGTFDPPHLGHMNNLEAAIERIRPDKVIVMPAGTPPHKAASATPGRIRVEMCQCFLPLHPNLEVSGWEIEQGGKSYTIDTILMLRAAYPDAELYLSIGSDMLLSFTTWRRWQELLQNTALVVQSREPGDGDELAVAADALRGCGGRIYFAESYTLCVSSSDVRAGLVPWELMPPLVQAVAAQHHLYGR